MFKAADGQNKQVKDGGLSLELILHLEGFFVTSVTERWESGSSSSRPMILSYQMVSFFNCGHFQLLGWVRIAISLKRQQHSEHATSMVMVTLPLQSLGMNRGTKNLRKPQNTFIRVRGTRRPWLLLELLAPA